MLNGSYFLGNNDPTYLALKAYASFLTVWSPLSVTLFAPWSHLTPSNAWAESIRIGVLSASVINFETKTTSAASVAPKDYEKNSYLTTLSEARDLIMASSYFIQNDYY